MYKNEKLGIARVNTKPEGFNPQGPHGGRRQPDPLAIF